MKLALGFVTVASLPLAFAHNHNHHRRFAQRDVLAASSASSVASTAKSSATVASSVASAASSVVTSAAGSASQAAASLPSGWLSTNPTAVPLSSINAAASSASTQQLPSVTAAGTKPTHISNAPGLPNANSIVVANYPTLDKTPPIDSAEVQQWIAEVKASGVTIPGWSPNVAGGCPANPEAVADTSRCWWTCGGCTNKTDVTTCPDKLHWGLTYDDGPSPYTPDLLNYLDQANLKATFYVVGSRALSYPGLLQKQYLSGHEIAVHTWSHPQLTTLTNEQIIAEFGWTKKIIKDVLGVTPLYMRPPYGDIDDRVRAICKAMNLIPVMWTRLSPTSTFDTADFDVHGGTATVGTVLSNWETILANATTINTGFIVLEHDLFQQTVEIATGYILPDALAFKPALTIEPVGTCLGLTAADSYIETNDNSTNPLPQSATAAPSGTASGAQATGGSSSSSNKTSGALASGVGLSGAVLAGAAAFGAAVMFV